MWAAISILAIIVFVVVLAIIWKDTPSTDWVTFDQVKENFPTWFSAIAVVLSFIFRKRGKIVVLGTIAVAGFTAVGAIWGTTLWQELLKWLLARFEPKQP